MNTYYYRICGLRLRLDASHPFPENTQSDLFLTGEAIPDVSLSLQAVDSIPEPSGTVCPAPLEIPTFRDGTQISRCSWDTFRPHMHMRTDYSLEQPDQMTCFVREEYWPWATHSKYLWPGVMLNYLLLHHRGLIFHASCIEHQGQGILFTAPSQTGKSTQANLWQQYRHAQIINGDKTGISLNNPVMVHGVPFSGTSGICQNISVPLKAIVVLSQASENTVTLLSPSQAISALFPNLFVDRAISEEWQLALHLLLDLISQIPVYSLACTPDERAVIALEKVLYNT